MKICKECKYFRQSLFAKLFSVDPICEHPDYPYIRRHVRINNVTGVTNIYPPIYSTCDFARSQMGHCGDEGKHYEERNKK